MYHDYVPTLPKQNPFDKRGSSLRACVFVYPNWPVQRQGTSTRYEVSGESSSHCMSTDQGSLTGVPRYPRIRVSVNLRQIRQTKSPRY